jgi:phosphatidate phosphatase APP1
MSKLVKSVVKVVSSVVGGIFGTNQKLPTAPVVQAPTPLPQPDSEAIAAAKKKSIAAIVNRQGRASTILSGDSGSDTLGT